MLKAFVGCLASAASCASACRTQVFLVFSQANVKVMACTQFQCQPLLGAALNLQMSNMRDVMPRATQGCLTWSLGFPVQYIPWHHDACTLASWPDQVLLTVPIMHSRRAHPVTGLPAAARGGRAASLDLTAAMVLFWLEPLFSCTHGACVSDSPLRCCRDQMRWCATG